MNPTEKHHLWTRQSRACALVLCVLAAVCGGDGDRDQGEEATASTQDFRTAIEGMSTEVRATLDALAAQIDDLDRRYTMASGDMAAEWQETREEIRAHHQELEADLQRLGSAGEEEFDRLREEMAQDLEEVARRVQWARLESAEGAAEFVAEARHGLAGVEEDLVALEAEAHDLETEARESVADALVSFRIRVDEIRSQIDELADAAGDELAEERDRIARDISALTASVHRELLEARQGTEGRDEAG